MSFFLPQIMQVWLKGGSEGWDCWRVWLEGATEGAAVVLGVARFWKTGN